MYTTQTKSTKSKPAKLPIIETDKELAAFLVRLVDSRWNQFYDSLVLMYAKLDKFDLRYFIMEES